MDKPQTDFPTPELQAGAASARQADSPEVGAMLDRHGIAVILNKAYEWGGYRYSNPTDAIAAAKRGER